MTGTLAAKESDGGLCPPSAESVEVWLQNTRMACCDLSDVTVASDFIPLLSWFTTAELIPRPIGGDEKSAVRNLGAGPAISLDAELYDFNNEYAGAVAHAIWPKGRVARFEYIDLEDTGSGVGAKIALRAGMLYTALGINRVEVDAALRVGSWFWARAGFSFADDAERERGRLHAEDVIAELGLTIEVPVHPTPRDLLALGVDRGVTTTIDSVEDALGVYGTVRFWESWDICTHAVIPLGKAILYTLAPWRATLDLTDQDAVKALQGWTRSS